MLRAPQQRDYAPGWLVPLILVGCVLAFGSLLFIPLLRSDSNHPTASAPAVAAPGQDSFAASAPVSNLATNTSAPAATRPAADSVDAAEGASIDSAEWARLLESLARPPIGSAPSDAGIVRELESIPQPSTTSAAAPSQRSAVTPPESHQPSADAATTVAEQARRAQGALFGATSFTETAVDTGLAWLAAHQDPAGTWDAVDFQKQCPASDRCRHPAVHRIDVTIRPGLTGLCLAAFVGASYTDRAGPFQKTVTAARDALLNIQLETGAFGPDSAMSGYNDALATLGLAELQLQAPQPRVEHALRLAVGRLTSAQQALGGWDYLPAPLSDRCDTSITAWAVQALLACRAAGVDVPPIVLQRAALHFIRATQSDGNVWYSDAGEGFKIGADLRPEFRYGPAMCAAGLLCSTMLGASPDSPTIMKQRSLLLSEPPSASRLRGRDPSQLHSEYYWYYGTVAMFQFGGDDWTRWNADLRDAALPLQDREQTRDGIRKHSYGSWPAFGPRWGKWGRMGGRVYATAIYVLTLETYYRHTPAFLQAPSPLAAEHWSQFLGRAKVWERRQVAKLLTEARYEIGEPVLLAMLADPDAVVARLAAEGLLAIGSPLGREVLAAQVEFAPGWLRDRLQQRLAEISAMQRGPRRKGTIVRTDPALRLAIVDLPAAYLGMQLVSDGAAGAGQLRVIRRYSGHDRALAEWSGAIEDMPPPGSGAAELRE